MGEKLSKFSNYSFSLFPHETEYLVSINKFEDAEKKSILLKIRANSLRKTPVDIYDPSIDRRKYSYVMNWCRDKLSEIDVDKIFDKLLEKESQIMNDHIDRVSEKWLLKLFKTADSSFFSFMKLYDIARIYRHFLQIRLRLQDQIPIDNFLAKYKNHYEKARSINDKIHSATQNIITQYTDQKGNTKAHEKWLNSIYNDSTLDGYNRVLAWIRLIFIRHNYRQLDGLNAQFILFDEMLRNGVLYSRRIIANYHSQCLLYYTSVNDIESAIYNGYLSIREKNNDYLYYVNNLAALLLKAGRVSEAYQALKNANTNAKNSQNFHNKIGHISYLILAHINLNQFKQAENSAEVFFTVYKKEIFDNRWHLFISAYFLAILYRKNFKKIAKLYKQYNIDQRDESYKEGANYTPIIPWIMAIAHFNEGQLSLSELENTLIVIYGEFAERSTRLNDSNFGLLKKILTDFVPQLGDIFAQKLK